jgi:quercetin dioxygenase-like cupin family protein
MSKLVSRSTEINLHQIRPNLSGTVIEGDRMTLVRWVAKPDEAATPMHSHAQYEQFTIIVEGSIEITVGEEVLVLSAGDVLRLEPGVQHGNTRPLNHAGAVLIDVFQPIREDYVSLAKGSEA